jgi:hypothetical protein
MTNITTVKQMELTFDKDKTIERSFIIPIKDLLLGMKLVEKDTDRKVPIPYVKIEIYVPQEVGTTIKDVLNSEWKIGLIGIKNTK